MSDVFRRLVARTLAQQFAKTGEVDYTVPGCPQHSGRVRVRRPCPPVDDRIGRVGHHPLCGRCGGLRSRFQERNDARIVAHGGRGQVVPFTQLYSSPSTLCGRISWASPTTSSKVREVSRDPSMPLLLRSTQLWLLFDDLYIKSHPNRTVDCLHTMRQELWNHSKKSQNTQNYMGQNDGKNLEREESAKLCPLSPPTLRGPTPPVLSPFSC